MNFTEKTVFPVFSQDNNNKYRFYLHFGIGNYLRLESDLKDFCLIQEKPYFVHNETQITKEAFIEANKDLLQKTGLINLFEGSEKDEDEITTDIVRDEYVRQYTEELKEQTKSFEAVIEKQQEKIAALQSRNEFLEIVSSQSQKEIKFFKRIIKKLTK